ncbi:hypothetical protein V9T40_014944 [Parthenolecanium corni]|uniref:Uncharacterized protein n=1 Tax=Parthenolecanium corni TaxID=536013 RepID=A0AAN9TMC6_9HEMI
MIAQRSTDQRFSWKRSWTSTTTINVPTNVRSGVIPFERGGRDDGRSNRGEFQRVRTHVCYIDYLAPPTRTTGAKQAANRTRKSASSSPRGGDERRRAIGATLFTGSAEGLATSTSEHFLEGADR